MGMQIVKKSKQKVKPQKTKKKADIIAEKKILRVLDLIRMLHSRPRTIEDIMIKLKISNRSLYRYLKLLGALEIKVDKSDKKTIYIPKDQCPICGHIRPYL
jgi:hypothetical protein